MIEYFMKHRQSPSFRWIFRLPNLRLLLILQVGVINPIFHKVKANALIQAMNGRSLLRVAGATWTIFHTSHRIRHGFDLFVHRMINGAVHGLPSILGLKSIALIWSSFGTGSDATAMRPPPTSDGAACASPSALVGWLAATAAVSAAFWVAQTKFVCCSLTHKRSWQ